MANYIQHRNVTYLVLSFFFFFNSGRGSTVSILKLRSLLETKLTEILCHIKQDRFVYCTCNTGARISAKDAIFSVSDFILLFYVIYGCVFITKIH